MRGTYTKLLSDTSEYLLIVKNILDIKERERIKVEQFCDEDINYNRTYNVFKITIDRISYLLKKSGIDEVNVYKTYLQNQDLPVPRYYGSTNYKDELWLLIEYIEGNDLRDFTLEYAHACATSIVNIMNRYWKVADTTDPRFKKYYARITKRSLCLEKEPLLQQAYAIFLNRQLTCPLTLSNGDFLQFNGIFKNGKVIVIDWGFGGIMPYSLDIARLIAHGSEDKKAFPFYMNDTYRKIYIDDIYKQLNETIARDQFEYDIKLSLLNEYIEFIERELNDETIDRDEGFTFYYDHAQKIAKEILDR